MIFFTFPVDFFCTVMFIIPSALTLNVISICVTPLGAGGISFTLKVSNKLMTPVLDCFPL
jgi:hypothetical protein